MIMSKPISFIRKAKKRPEVIIAVQDILLEYILSNRWKDYEGFARSLSERITLKTPKTESQVVKCIKDFPHPFYSFNSINKNLFLQRFPTKRILDRMEYLFEEQIADEKTMVTAEVVKSQPILISPTQLLPDIEKTTIEEAKQLLPKLNVKERIIQDTLRTALRERGASRITERKSDTSLEIADLEDFSLEIGSKWLSFVSIVKGYASLKKKRVRWEDIAHQITKGYQGTVPNYVLLVLAKDPVDGLITQLINYGKTVGNRNLVILIDPLNLARFLHARKII